MAARNPSSVPMLNPSASRRSRSASALAWTTRPLRSRMRTGACAVSNASKAERAVAEASPRRACTDHRTPQVGHEGLGEIQLRVGERARRPGPGERDGLTAVTLVQDIKANNFLKRARREVVSIHIRAHQLGSGHHATAENNCPGVSDRPT